MKFSVTAPFVYSSMVSTSSTPGNDGDMAKSANLWLCAQLYTSVLFRDAIQWVVIAVIGYGVNVLSKCSCKVCWQHQCNQCMNQHRRNLLMSSK